MSIIKKLFIILLIHLSFSCAELQDVVNSLPTETTTGTLDIAGGLRQALDKGITKQVSKLTQKDGYYKNNLVKIVMPEELQKVDKALRNIGLGNLADEGIKALNRAAEDAVKEAIPIFVDTVKQINFNDAKGILLGSDIAATNYLKGKTKRALYSKFNPVIKNSFDRVGADQIWKTIITNYNSIPFVTKVNPDLTDYVTKEALKGVFKMIAVEEKEIRNNINSRTTTLLQQVFALQD
ncbi:MAG: hypothetical protein COB12_07500 [Flavobacterium sp.]|nr:MAG: hypothetical protein COB12_07500 [Flavobacterium sp.]